MAVLAQDDGFIEPSQGGFGLGQHAVDVDACALDLGRDHIVVDPTPRGRAAFQYVGTQVVAEGHRDQSEITGKFLQFQIGHDLGAFVSQRPDVNI